MKEYYWIIRQSPLFDSADEETLDHILRCLDAYIAVFGKGEIICHYGDCTAYAGMVLEGKAAIAVPGPDGEESSIRTAEPAETFGCSHSCMDSQPSLITVTAKKQTKILFLKLSKLFRPEAICCPHASLVIANLLKQTAAANLSQSRRIHIMSQKTIRGKLEVFLDQSLDRKNTAILSMNRQELADYLGVERSALSREMGRMKREGLIDYCKNQITVLKKKEGNGCRCN